MTATPAETASKTTNTPIPTQTAQPSPSAEPATPLPISSNQGCQAGEPAFQQYVDEDAGISFCYPAGWQMEEGFGAYFLSPEGRENSFGQSQLIIIYPHGLIEFFTSEPIAFAADFFGEAVRDAQPAGDLITTEEDGRLQSLLHANGSIEGMPVHGFISGVVKDEWMAAVVAYIFDPDTPATLAEQILATVTPIPPLFHPNGANRLRLGQPASNQWLADSAGVYQFSAEVGQPLLVITEADTPSEYTLYGPDGRQVKRWISAPLSGPVGRGEISTFYYGYKNPDALVLQPEQSGDYALVVRMSPDIETDRGNYRLVVHEFGPTATIISSRETFTVQAGESSSHLFPALADQPVQVYLHLLSADAELRLNTVSEAGQMTDGGLLVSARVPERLLQWLPREDGQVTLQVNNQGGEAVDYELVILADQTPGREVMAASYPMFADIYTATLTVADDGSVTVVEDVHLTLNEAADTLSWSWDRHQLYRDSISGLILTYEGATCQPQAGDPAAFCQLDATNQTLTLS
ncbi:MAG: hypothetical protein KDE09_19490, partial [Anaerolineales bacterium]|nr:hypothetical protein [Anaerolineales bacterium]